MYLNYITLSRTLPCLAEPGKIIVIGKPDRALDDVIPYLATLPGIISYNPETCTLTFRRRPGFLTLYSDKVYITQVRNSTEGLELLTALLDAINEVWEHRDELVAITTKKRAPGHLEIWELLPRTNCRQCGEATCLAFAVSLIQQTHELDECIPLRNDPNQEGHRATLETML